MAITMGTPRLEVAQLSVRVPVLANNWVQALSGVSLTLGAGQMHAVIGESGCGKSTLGRAITGLLPRAAKMSGTIRYAGQSIAGRQKQLAGRSIALVAQSAATYLTPVRTVGCQLDETLRALQGNLSACELMARVDLDPTVLGCYPHQLSGGMAQRAAVAFALAGNPAVIVADEPTASLDPERTRGLLQLLRQCADAGTAVLLITHDIAALSDAGVADEVSVLHAGTRIEHGAAGALLGGHAQQPYTRALLAALPRNGLHSMDAQLLNASGVAQGSEQAVSP
ncbi:ATP-binding cassette domain-containing protein [Carnimonas bestiolae]|uniref:ATP-binding cassette domain-containing protein n=1 Tax=Carnimonas bestiolae TaxID=3402172 RepID=UPI003EDCB0F7